MRIALAVVIPWEFPFKHATPLRFVVLPNDTVGSLLERLRRSARAGCEDVTSPALEHGVKAEVRSLDGPPFALGKVDRFRFLPPEASLGTSLGSSSALLLRLLPPAPFVAATAFVGNDSDDP